MRRHRDTAADVGALIEFFSLQVLDPLPEAAAQQTSERAREIAGVAGDLSGSLKRPSEIGGYGEPIRTTGTHMVTVEVAEGATADVKTIVTAE